MVKLVNQCLQFLCFNPTCYMRSMNTRPKQYTSPCKFLNALQIMQKNSLDCYNSPIKITINCPENCFPSFATGFLYFTAFSRAYGGAFPVVVKRLLKTVSSLVSPSTCFNSIQFNFNSVQSKNGLLNNMSRNETRYLT